MLNLNNFLTTRSILDPKDRQGTPRPYTLFQVKIVVKFELMPSFMLVNITCAKLTWLEPSLAYENSYI